MIRELKASWHMEMNCNNDTMFSLYPAEDYHIYSERVLIT